MADNHPSAVNLDLNLGPLDNNNSSDDSSLGSGSYPTNIPMNLEDWLDGPAHRMREVVRQRSQRWRSLFRQVPIPQETRNLALEFSGQQIGEGSVAPDETVKTCENGNNRVEEETKNQKENYEKNNPDEGSFFDCNICLDLAKEPVVTCCGHLFCWPCLYRWLQHHSDAKECPICKGEVTVKTVTPIYGRGNNNNSNNNNNNNNNVLEAEENSSLNIPRRPQARRVESWRQAIQRTAFTVPMEEMIRRLGSTFDLSRELTRNADESSPERSNSLLNRILTSSGMRRERTPAIPADDFIDLIDSNSNPSNNRRQLSSLLLRSHRTGLSNSNLNAAINPSENLAAERLVESYFDNNVGRYQELPLMPVDDRDSLSSIAAIIQSESHTADNAVEIDSRVSLSTSSSRRRYGDSRISDVDSGDSRAPRRRRLG